MDTAGGRRVPAVGVGHPAEFVVDRADRAGAVRSRVHRLDQFANLLGYNVALPDDRNQAGEPVYYAGSTLAADLSLPRIRERFTTTPAEAHHTANHETDGNRHKPSAATTARRSATHAAWAALRTFDQDGDGATAARITATGEILDALAMTSATDTRQQLREAAWVFERARLSHTRAEHRHGQALRLAARELLYSGPARGRGEDGATTAMLIDTLCFLMLAAAHWHDQRRHAQQAEAARQAAARLRTAYATTAEAPLALLQEQGRQIIRPVRDWYALQVHVALPDLADSVIAEPGWPALVATMAQTEQAGHDPRTLLAEAADLRELDSASSVSDVLTWRLRRMADLPADATHPRHGQSSSYTSTAQTPRQPVPSRPRR
ncbi:hypothetical protein ACWDE0_15645 [Streptomyces sp. 900105755]